ncbi:MAG: MBL fold metallo-hydrolase [Pseudomonadota bacterium]
MQYLTILGCGSSWGVPVIGCKCKTCSSPSSYNKRSRSSIIIRDGVTSVLVDFGGDVRNQLLRENIDRLDAVILTHDHADHCSGLDDLRIFSLIHGMIPKFYSDHNTVDVVTKRYSYLFDKKALEPIGVDFDAKIRVGDIEIQLFKQDHGVMDSLGLRIKNTVYTNDVLRYPEESKQYLRNAKIWVADCVDYKSTGSHIGLDQAIQLYEEFTPERVYITNMSHDIDYFDIQPQLPQNVSPAYDGLRLEII